jgi:hypothetical protein
MGKQACQADRVDPAEQGEMREVSMGSCKRHSAFDPLDLEIIDLAFVAAWAQLIAHKPNRDSEKDEALREALRKRIFVLAGRSERVDFDMLCETAVTSMTEYWV